MDNQVTQAFAQATQAFAQARLSGSAPGDAVVAVMKQFPSLPLVELASVLRGAAGAAADSIVTGAVYIAQLLLAAKPAATPAEIAVALRDKRVYPNLTAVQMSEVLHNSQMFPKLTAGQLAPALTAAAYTPDEVKQAVDEMFPPPRDGLLAWWPLSIDAADRSGHGRNGQLVGAHIVPGVRGASGAAEMGRGAAIRVPRVEISATDFTFAAWVRLSTVNHRNILFGDWTRLWQALIAVRGGAVAVNLRRNINSGGFDPNQDLIILVSEPQVTQNQWCHVAVTWSRSAGQCMAYVNGAVAGIASAKPSDERDLQVDDHPYFWIGRKEDSDDGDSWLEGMIADVRIYDRTLGGDEIKQLSG